MRTFLSVILAVVTALIAGLVLDVIIAVIAVIIGLPFGFTMLLLGLIDLAILITGVINAWERSKPTGMVRKD